jgi:predicted TIM-barrel fold metal-dependent hydrolase
LKVGRRDWLKLAAMTGTSLFPAVSNAGGSGQGSGAGSATPPQRWGNGVNPGQTLPPEATNGPWRNLRAVKEKKVFDVHCHPWGSLPGHKEAKDNTNELIALMDFYGIVQAALSPSHVAYETIATNDVAPHLDRFIRVSGLPTNATQGKQLTPDLVAEQCRLALELNGCKMVGESGSALQGLQSRYSVSELRPIIDVVRRYDVPVLLHTGWSAGAPHISPGQDMTEYMQSGASTNRSWPDYVGALLAEYPDVKFILAHTGGALAIPDGHEALRLLFWYDNAYVDTSTSPVEIIAQAVRGVGAERVMFGSDWNHPGLEEIGPFPLRAVYTHWWNLNNIANADLTEDERDWVLYKSARKLLKLPEA